MLWILIEASSSFIPAYVIERFYWEDRGMSIADVVIAEIVFAWVMLIGEVPFGLLSDRWGRKPFILAGFVCEWLSFTVLIEAYSLPAFLLAMVLAGIGGAALSGALEAHVYETLRMHRIEERFEMVWRMTSIGGLLTSGLAALVGSYAAQSVDLIWHYHVSWWGLLGTALLTFFLKEASREQNVETSSLKTLLNGFSFRRVYVRILCLVLLYGATIDFVDEFWQLYLRDQAIPMVHFGFVFVLFQIMQAIGASLSRLRSPVGWAMIYIVCLTGLSVASPLVSIGLLGILYLCYGWAEPYVTTVIQEVAPESGRATFTSLISVIERLTVLGTGTLFVFVERVFSLQMTYAALGLVSLILLLLYGMTRTRQN
ncbi:MFS transporter [uncultured Exiguobacterium sp.]|uniref:MFS transporter n=1 Tax=uncultured Exiguobacterium sp. TaxID=202669 RepID=UPI0025EA50B2|nr:MFS transporter [uncultured Exiguobacterium sp.]